MTDTTKVADLPAAWRRTAKSAGIPVAATFNACADELEAALAARQPVGQEPVAWIEARDLERLAEDDPEDPHAFEHVYPGPGEWGGRVPLYAAPPAQAVDLEQFREALTSARAVWEDYADTWSQETQAHKSYAEKVAECDRLLALTDQQAGKGVSRG